MKAEILNRYLNIDLASI